MTFVDGRKYRDRQIYKKVRERLRKAGFVGTPDQIKLRWKTLEKATSTELLIIRRAAVIVVVLDLDTGRRSRNEGNYVMTFSVRRWFDPDK